MIFNHFHLMVVTTCLNCQDTPFVFGPLSHHAADGFTPPLALLKKLSFPQISTEHLQTRDTSWEWLGLEEFCFSCEQNLYRCWDSTCTNSYIIRYFSEQCKPLTTNPFSANSIKNHLDNIHIKLDTKYWSCWYQTKHFLTACNHFKMIVGLPPKTTTKTSLIGF